MEVRSLEGRAPRGVIGSLISYTTTDLSKRLLCKEILTKMSV